MRELITIFILARNRADYATKMIESLAIQNNRNFRLVLSDNSKPKLHALNDLAKKCKYKFEKFDYKLRDGAIDLWSHLNICVDECVTEYINILHDDDLVNPDYVNWIISSIDSNPNINIMAPNAYKINEQGIITGQMRYSNCGIEIKNTDELYNSYFNSKSSGIACFPFYTYRLSVLKAALKLPLTCGYYSDVEILSRIVNQTPIYWSDKLVCKYRMHGENISKSENIKDRYSLGNLIKKTSTKNTSSNYKSWLIYSLIITKLKNKNLSLIDLLISIIKLKPSPLEILQSVFNLIKKYGNKS